MTNDDVLGDAISADQQDELQLKCYQLLKLPPVIHICKESFLDCTL